MVFSSYIFLLVFLVVHYAAYLLVDDSKKNLVLLISSLVFYAWGGVRFIVLLMGETLVGWAVGRALKIAKQETARKGILAGGCVILLTLLAYFKYAGFLSSMLKALTGFPEDPLEVALPIGISFYTFQLISYMADVYRGEIEAQPHYWKLLLYSSLFHQCVAGPIVRYESIATEIDDRTVKTPDVFEGIRRFCVGLAKKVVLANGCAAAADTLIPLEAEALAGQYVTGYWLGVIFYTLQIYLDFSAYTDMAIGLGRTIGFHYPENFDHPYEASSVQDFWRRWHISLSMFFRDYVYIPLGGSRAGEKAYIRNMCVVWLLTGLWHGASWNYVLWGAFYLGLLLLEHFFIKDSLPPVAQRLLTILAICVGWVIFRFESFASLGIALAGLLGIGSAGFTGLAVHTVLMQNIFLLIASLIACTSLGARIHALLHEWSRRNRIAATIYGVSEALTPPVLFLLSVIALAGASYNPFIYFQF